MMNWKQGLRAFQAVVRPHISAAQPTLVRGKRTTKLAPGASRVINMVSVISARKKQPRRLKMCKEDQVRHQMIMAAWKLHLRDEKAERTNKLKAQYEKITEACDELQKLDPALYEAATAREKGKRFSPEMRIPTDTPPRQPWQFDWSPPDK